MATISVSLPSDGTTADVSDVNTPINTIVNEINGNLDNANIKSGAAIDGSKIADASITNAKLATTAGQPGGAWDTWTPTLTNLSGGSINVARYKQIGKLVHFEFKYTLGGAGVTGSVSFTLPVTGAASQPTLAVIGNAQLEDTGTNVFYGFVRYDSTSAASVLAWNASGTYLSQGTLSSTVPHTWANTDVIYCFGTYEAA